MLYFVIRSLIAAAAGGMAYVMLQTMGGKRVRREESRIRLYAVGISIALLFGLYLMPIENKIMSFSSSQAAYKYNNFGSIIEIEEYDSCALVFSITGEQNITASLLPSYKGKWRLATLYNQKRDIASVGYYVAEKHYIPCSEDFVIIVAHGTAGNSLDSPTNVADSVGTKFNAVSYNDVPTFYYGYVVGADEDYSLMIDGNKVVL